MSRQVSPSTERAYGLERVTRVWGVSRATVYRHRRPQLHAVSAFKMPGGTFMPYVVLAFFAVGMGTSCMYLPAVTTCAKNFGRGNAKGIALAVPIAAFGLGL